jgi:hypothetical protein
VSGEGYRDPPWLGPADNVVAGPAALGLLTLGRRADGATAWLSRFTATPDGVAFTVSILAEDPPPRGLTRGDDVLRVGVRFADGRAAEVDLNDHFRVPDLLRPADGIALSLQGAGESEHRWDQDVWLWPVPPAGALAFTSSWGEDVVLDAAPLRAAADAAVELWVDDRPYWPEPGEEDDADLEDDDEGGGWLDYVPAESLPRMAPGALGVAPVLVRTDAVAAWLSGLEATRHGLAFRLRARWREPRAFDDDEGPLARDLPFALRVEHDGVELAQYGGGGSGTNSAVSRDLSVAPLPTEGTLRFVLSWPAEGVEAAVVELDAALVRAAAERAVVLWPDEADDVAPGA